MEFITLQFCFYWELLQLNFCLLTRVLCLSKCNNFESNTILIENKVSLRWNLYHQVYLRLNARFSELLQDPHNKINVFVYFTASSLSTITNLVTSNHVHICESCVTIYKIIFVIGLMGATTEETHTYKCQFFLEGILLPLIHLQWLNYGKASILFDVILSCHEQQCHFTHTK